MCAGIAFCLNSYRENPVNAVQHLLQAPDTGGVSVLPGDPGPPLGAAGVVTHANVGLDTEGGVACVTGHVVVGPHHSCAV